MGHSRCVLTLRLRGNKKQIWDQATKHFRGHRFVLLKSKNQNQKPKLKLIGFLGERGIFFCRDVSCALHSNVSRQKSQSFLKQGGDDWKDYFLNTTITAKRVERKSEKQGE